MKRLFILSVVLAPLLAQTQVNTPDPLSDVELSTYTRNYIFGTPEISYDRIFGDRVVYSGLAIQLIRAPNPLHLINPWAPKEYGPSDQNLATDPVTGKPAGIRLFAISF
jgi:hypothetical protein